ncbi:MULTISPECIES: hypothetical protein [Pseudomonas]|uniref:hypothetical protein n=1 Tax=Pseudomonas TaxID=286 RepID=UPI001BAFCD5D|nr:MULTISPECIES: hypothetical protein [Pseudomonas]EKT4484295.1 hypothetical protein [Pseudomonas putida]QUG93458.1 hypothetical protein GR140_32410 [Pseudomonas putida]URD45751.1 hypothetical protein M6G63_28305 [Pseudomonas sp. BYT-5]URL00997.1 hypothetical protein J5X93_27995 [Pseudomonas sp. BYT-1]WRW06915.1 hypothetical protein VPZ82_30445 [Pseudomonas putida]
MNRADSHRKPQLFNVLDSTGQVVFQGTINGCSHWVDLHARGKVCVERVRRSIRKGVRYVH